MREVLASCCDTRPNHCFALALTSLAIRPGAAERYVRAVRIAEPQYESHLFVRSAIWSVMACACRKLGFVSEQQKPVG